MIVVKAGEEFRCWNCGKKCLYDVKKNIYINDEVRCLYKKCRLNTHSSPNLRENGGTISDNFSKCSRCSVLIYDKLPKNCIPDELFEI